MSLTDSLFYSAYGLVLFLIIILKQLFIFKVFNKHKNNYKDFAKDLVHTNLLYTLSINLSFILIFTFFTDNLQVYKIVLLFILVLFYFNFMFKQSKSYDHQIDDMNKKGLIWIIDIILFLVITTGAVLIFKEEGFALGPAIYLVVFDTLWFLKAYLIMKVEQYGSKENK